MTHDKYDQIAGYLKILLCLFPNTAMAYGIKLIVRNEEMGDGFNWSTMWRSITVYDSLTIGTTIVFMLLSSFVFMVLTLYVESIFPGSYGVAKPWYFPFKKEFWCRTQVHRNYQSFDNDNDDHVNDDNSSERQVETGNFEEEPANEHPGVQIRNLCKSYGKNVAVSNLSMKMFNNQITALLGHNGGAHLFIFYFILQGYVRCRIYIYRCGKNDYIFNANRNDRTYFGHSIDQWLRYTLKHRHGS